jgi:hypothetical protein
MTGWKERVERIRVERNVLEHKKTSAVANVHHGATKTVHVVDRLLNEWCRSLSTNNLAVLDVLEMHASSIRQVLVGCVEKLITNGQVWDDPKSCKFHVGHWISPIEGSKPTLDALECFIRGIALDFG